MNRRNEKAITLIALVVTIVVLLILAGISIAMLSGENGIITQAQDARDESKKAEVVEQVRLAVMAAKTEGLGSLDMDTLNSELEKIGYEGEKITTLPKEVEIDGVKVTIEADGKITDSGDSEDITQSNIEINLTLSHTEQVPEESGNVKELTDENVPIPAGYYYVGGTKDTGVVISDVAGDDLNNTAQGNQFVWVPVKQNQVLTLEVESEEEIEGITLTYPGGTEEIAVNGTSYNGEITMRANGLYVVEVTTATETKSAEKRISSLYECDMELLIISELKSFINNAYETYETKSELLAAKGYDSIEKLLEEEGGSSLGQYMFLNHIYVKEAENELMSFGRQFLGSLNNEENNTENVETESVNKYGGFYIARYEGGDGSTTEARTEATPDTNEVVSKKGAYVYNYIEQETAPTLATELRGNNTSVTTQLITQEGWERTLNWIIETGEKTEDQIVADSRSWGNFSDSTETAIENSGLDNMNYTTGRSEYWKTNNIYDLAGNVREFIQTTNGVFYTGGTCQDSGIGTNLLNIFYTTPHNEATLSFRTQLYINV